jgi:hypothetical protein
MILPRESIGGNTTIVDGAADFGFPDSPEHVPPRLPTSIGGSPLATDYRPLAEAMLRNNSEICVNAAEAMPRFHLR